MIKRVAKSLISNISNVPGWHTKRNLVVFESDDWGSIRMPSKHAFKNLQDNGIDMLSDEGILYNKYDTLANSDDLSSLFTVLDTVKDKTGRSAVFTPCAVVANPDFAKIEDDGFKNYYYEPFSETLKNYPGCENSYSLWKEGIKKRLFIPQFHGKEHLNVAVWMRALGDGNKNARSAFNNKMWGISTSDDPAINLEFQAAFDFIDPDDIKKQGEIIQDGLNLFEELFGYRAKYFVPPNGPFSLKLESVCSENDIRYLFTAKKQVEPLGHGQTKTRFRYMGQKTKSGLIYFTRTCFFEPIYQGKDWVDSCLFDIANSYRWKKPAIISAHRLNFIGALYQENRDNGLKHLEILLKRILKHWPETEFVTSNELGKIIEND